MNLDILFAHFLELCLDTAPWLVLGLVIGGLIKTMIPGKWLESQLQGHGLWPVTKAALIGAPLPLCSCGVLPAALGLRRAGASKAATTSFLISTPETGIDSVLVSYALLGPLMAITRPIAAILSAITAGLLVGKEEHRSNNEPAASDTTATASCCSNSPVTDSCSVAHQHAQAVDPKNTSGVIAQGLEYAFTDLLKDIALWLLLGLIFSAAVMTWIPPEFLSQWGSGLPAMLIMIAISIPMYVCATASTPIAAGLILSGISPGTVLVFLLAGPASNIGSLAIIKKEFGLRTIIAYLAGVVLVAIASGLALDALINTYGINVQAQISASEHLIPAWISWLGLAILLIASARLIWLDRTAGQPENGSGYIKPDNKTTQ